VLPAELHAATDQSAGSGADATGMRLGDALALSPN
jgi:hypothetical protein